jgi:hypothetical protein
VSLVPTVDLVAAKERIEQLEEDLENAGLALFLQERLPVLAIGRRDRMIAYAKAARRVKEQAAQEGQSS